MADNTLNGTDHVAPRSLHDISMDTMDLDERGVQQLMQPLEVARRKAAALVQNFDPEKHPEGFRGAVDAVEPDIDAAERSTIDTLQQARASAMFDREALGDQPYRLGLPDAKAQQAEAKSIAIASRLPSMTAKQINDELHSAVLHQDEVTMAAWALNGHAIRNRKPDPNNGPLGDGTVGLHFLSECEATTGDTRVTRTRRELDEAIARIDSRILEVTSARTAHKPGHFGSVLASFPFGQRQSSEQVENQRRYDANAVMTRLGKRSG